MRRRLSVFLLLLTACPPAAFAGRAAESLNDQQRLGRRLLAQSCGVCHLPPALRVQTYGPPLNQGTNGGNDAVIRGMILDGTPRMPGFKYYFQPAEIDAIIAYVKTVAMPAPAATGGR